MQKESITGTDWNGLARALIKFLDLGLNLALGLHHFVHIIRELSNPLSLLVSFCNKGNSSVPISILQLYQIEFQISRMQLSGILSESESRLRIQRQNAKRERTRFYRRKKSIFKSGYDLHKQCHAEVYILVRRSGRSYILSCAENDKSPFSDQALNQCYPVPQWSYPEDFRTPRMERAQEDASCNKEE
ncbi:hypothetical protein PV08_12037 [Exophiala spinifera]|uniref:Uncharacterized protein n=1 Tax=Exophiala spinifera TaxID=91928 RepID=A0A0D2BE75_9EURO|nr:uncharacterized protein PV08_12037 [Exophiala spinifera]KIW09694.1 hypothetical protein PV08_12037 [Exophiala spinifera]